MILIKSKSDGKYFTNPGYAKRRKVYYGADPVKAFESMWVEDPNLCRPFKNREGAEMSALRRGWLTDNRLNVFTKDFNSTDFYELVKVKLDVEGGRRCRSS